MFIVAFVSFVAGIIFVSYPAYYCYKYTSDRNEAYWTDVIQDRFEKIPDSYHEAFEKGWNACANSETTIRMQYQKFFGNLN